LTKAIVIGAGKSFWESDVLREIILLSNDGLMNDVKFVLCERIAHNVIEAGLNPDLDIHIVTQEDIPTRKDLFNFECFYHEKKIWENRDKFHVWISRTSHNHLHWFLKNSFEKYHTFTRRSAPIKVEPHDTIDPLINTCGNVGMACYGIARTVLGCDQIAFLGMDLKPYPKHDDPSNPSWEIERTLTKRELSRNKNDISNFDLGDFGDDNYLFSCSLSDFINDHYVNIISKKYEVLF